MDRREPQKAAPALGGSSGRGIESDLWKGEGFVDGVNPTRIESANQLLARPRAGTVAERILRALESGRAITSERAWKEFGCSRLAAVVCNLRRLGWRIKSRTVEVRCADGRVAHVASYSMEAK